MPKLKPGNLGKLTKALFDERWMPITETGCHIWLGASITNAEGHGKVWFRGKLRVATHVAWFFEYGEFPKTPVLRHSCDIGSCVNVKHLLEGTQFDNMMDKTLRGRGNVSILTPLSVIEIRRRADVGDLHREIAFDYEITRSSVSMIARRETWAWVKG